ncbi:hypothetical protein FACS1894181_05550 [Bacteroidia bacterium]|nr:hypothetical protein FACS1894181_05550 [Bacteroidia bacterium]
MNAQQVKEHKRLLSRITIPQRAGFHKEVCSQIEPLVPQVSGIAPSFNIYKAASEKLNTTYNQRTKSIMTEELVGIDEIRDGITEALINLISFYLKFPENEAEAEAARLLKFEADAYKNTPRKDYPTETVNVRSLTTDLRKHPEAIALLGLDPLITRLETKNNLFEGIYNARANAFIAKSKRGTLTDLATQANDAFDIFCRVIDGVSLMQLDAATRSAVDQIIDIINAQIHQYTIVYHHHAGVIAAKKKDNGDGGDGGDEGDEGDGDGDEGDEGDGEGGEPGEPGEGGTENPDIENPPPPPFLPDFE